MDEDIAIINNNTRNEKIKIFFTENKKKIATVISIIFIMLLSYFSFSEYKKKKKIEISNQYNSIIIKYSKNNKEITKNSLVNLVNSKDPTYSVLSLYFIIDNRLIADQVKVNDLFDVVIKEISLEEEIKNLIIYKKALYNADISDENQLLDILNPVINSESVWKAHAIYLMAEYFYSNGENIKSKEFFNQIVALKKANQDIKIKAQKRLNRDLSE
jgi:predicted negative regulator of RcsB-dependent stress response